ncbi:hypothetical protein [Empedobacter brevis]|uniref:hypothetical protein n=1 Tax=Empedobacter brevis TaxID=247 RepID=UPI0028AC23FF|nr:hypothetical protein [Empedobacter brevis]
MLISCIILNSCTNEKVNGDNTSNSINESKINNVFIEEFIPTNRVIDIKKKYIIEECWLEQRWNYKNFNLDIHKLSDYRFVLKIKNTNDDEFTNKMFVDIVNINSSQKINPEFGYYGNLRTMSLKDKIDKDSLIIKFVIENKESDILFIKK